MTGAKWFVPEILGNKYWYDKFLEGPICGKREKRYNLKRGGSRKRHDESQFGQEADVSKRTRLKKRGRTVTMAHIRTTKKRKGVAPTI